MSLRETLQHRGIDVEQGTSATLFDGRAPSCVARPTSTGEVAETVRAAREHGAVVAVRGAGTKLTWGSPAGHLDLVLDLSAMNRVLEHQPGDLIVSAEAGCPLNVVQSTVAQAGQRLALDEMVPGTTVGGLIATNTSGPLRVLAGTVRDLLIGVTVVLADGTVAHAGGKVVKNVAGYDLGKLMVGSYGTLAIVTEATFRLHPVPQASEWVVGQHPIAELPHVLNDLLHSQDAPSAVEIRCETADSVVLAVLIEGTEGGVSARSGRIRATVAGETAPAPGWTGTYPWPVGEGIGLKITAQLSAVPNVVAAAAELGWTIQGSAGAGVLYASPSGAAEPNDVEAAAARFREVALGGSVIVLDAPKEMRGQVDVWGPIPAIDIMRRVKQQFDPENHLAPGRFVGGI